MNRKNNEEIREDKIKNLFSVYPVLKMIEEKNEGIIKNNVQFRTLQADEDISSKGKGTCQGILFVLNGNINIKRINEDGDETNLYNIGEGELCHEALSCLLSYKPLNIMGMALQKSEICIVPMDIVKKVLLESSEFLSYMYKDIYEKFTFVIEIKEDKNHKSVESRIVEYFLNKKTSIIYETHKDIAFEIDSRREVVSRKLKLFEKEGYIRLERGKISILKDLNEILKKIEI